MATSIPYDPSVQLTGIVPQDTLDTLLAIAREQAPVASAQEGLNRAIMTVRSLEMTMSEMVNMGIDASAVTDSLKKAKQNVQKAAKDVIDAEVGAWEKLNTLKGKLSQVSEQIESPVDYNRTQIKMMPLSADSITMDAQYFSHDGVDQEASNSMTAIRGFVSAATSFLGDKASAEATAAAQQQVAKQIEHHGIEGTLIITASCTHKQAAVLAPFHLDVDKAIRIYNEMYPDNMIKTNDRASIQKIAKQQQTKDEKKFNIVSEANYGSSFIGMVHVLKTSDTQSSQRMISTAASLRAQMEVGSWFAKKSGGFGMDASFSSDAKKLLSSQDISSHISLICMGVIPSIVANDVTIATKQFAKFDPAEMMGKLADLQNATAGDNDTIGKAAADARTGAEMGAIQTQKIKAVVSSVAEVEDGKNRMLDINSLMTAFEDYVNKAGEGKAGVPVTYYIKPITASQLAQMWVAKYFPGEYVTSAGDDDAPEEPGTKDSSE